MTDAATEPVPAATPGAAAAAAAARADDSNETPARDSAHSAERAAWLRILALAAADELSRLASPVLADYRFEWLRRPEQGLVMVRARIGNSGDRFNVGEATVTRCAVRHQSGDGRVVAGVGHVLGRDEGRCERVAQIDALLQVPALRPWLQSMVLQPLQQGIEARRRDERGRTATSQVRFFTLQPEVA